MFGYCLGGVLSLLFVAGHPEIPVRESGAPGDTGGPKDMSPVVRLLQRATSSPRSSSTRPATCHRQWCSTACASTSRPGELSGYADLWQHLHEDEFVKSYQALMGWARDHIPLPGATFRQLVDLFVRRNLLADGPRPLGDRVVDLAAIRCPVLNIVGDHDDIVPPKAIGRSPTC